MLRNGVDRLTEYSSLFQGKRLGLMTSSSGRDRNLISTTQLLTEAYEVTAFFAPEHGIRGEKEAGDVVETYKDSATGIPVYSLYRKDSTRLTKDMLDKVDTVVFDIQDIGTRYYTYISTLHQTIEDCAMFGKELIVLDRYNPLGDTVEGGVLDLAYKSFVGTYSIPIRHGLTVGEFATMVNEEQALGCQLTVVPVTGWQRESLFFDTGALWLLPSPNMPSFETALFYPGSCLFEGTNLSEGRGTTIPFQCVGAPFVHAEKLAQHMNSKKLPGVLFAPYYFTPTFSKFTGEFSEGVKYYLTDAQRFQPVRTGLELLYSVMEFYPEDFTFLPSTREDGIAFIELLAGDSRILDKTPLDTLLTSYEKESQEFAERKKRYELYK